MDRRLVAVAAAAALAGAVAATAADLWLRRGGWGGGAAARRRRSLSAGRAAGSASTAADDGPRRKERAGGSSSSGGGGAGCGEAAEAAEDEDEDEDEEFTMVSEVKDGRAPPQVASAVPKRPSLSAQASSDGLLSQDGQDVLFGRYQVLEFLGQGGFAKVVKARAVADGREVAVKIVNKRRMRVNREQLDAEVDILKRIEHPGIVKLYDVMETDRELIMVMELCDGGELFDRIVERGSYCEADAVGIVRAALQALRHLHARGIIHRDIKPENILLTSDSAIKLADFGLARVLGSAPGGLKRAQTQCGSPQYMAPEVLSGGHYDEKVDIWAIGIIGYILLVGYPPFDTAAVSKGDWEVHMDPDDWATISPDAKDFVCSLLERDPDARPSAHNALAHRWVAVDAAPEPNAPALSSALANLARFNAKRRFRSTALAHIAMARMRSIGSSTSLVGS